jgi:AcrR family transcriptional regulator
VAAPGRTRERILDVALELFAEHGYEGTPITAIERRVGLAAGTGSFHRHFRSKEELLHAAVEREVGRLMAEIESASAAAPAVTDPHAGTVEWLERSLVDIARFDRLFRLMLTEGDRLPDLRATFASALGFDSPTPSWSADVDGVVAVAALAGYHYLGLLQGRPFQGVQAAEFVDALARLLRSR